MLVNTWVFQKGVKTEWVVTKRRVLPSLDVSPHNLLGALKKWAACILTQAGKKKVREQKKLEDSAQTRRSFTYLSNVFLKTHKQPKNMSATLGKFSSFLQN